MCHVACIMSEWRERLLGPNQEPELVQCKIPLLGISQLLLKASLFPHHPPPSYESGVIDGSFTLLKSLQIEKAEHKTFLTNVEN